MAGRGSATSDPTGVEAMINPFRGVTPSTVTSLGTVSSGGKTLYRLDATKALPMDLSLVAPNVVDPTSDTYTLTFDVLQDGTPVSGRAEVLPYATGTLDGTSVKIESYTDWTFTDFGQPATIAPPA